MRESMPTQRVGGSGSVGESLRTLFSIGTLSGLTDGQLLERFAQGRGGMPDSEAAFTALVERHGPMVLGVCQAVLGDRHDAEDACQATFLVLARRAGLIRRRDSRRQAARRRELERRRLARIRVTEPVSGPPAEPWPELYEELDRLREPFRAAVVLCDLEGHSYEQAAGILHCPVGTLQSRLARGREQLRHRLKHRGLSPAIAMAGSGAGLTGRTASVVLSPQLARAIVHEAIGITTERAIVGAAHALAGTEIRRQVMLRVLTGLTAWILTGLIAATTIGLAIAGRNDDRPNPRVAEATKKVEAGPLYVRVVDGEGEDAAGVLVEVHAWHQPRRTFSTDAQGRSQIPREAIGDVVTIIARRDGESLAWANLSIWEPNRSATTKDDPLLLKLVPLTHRVEGSVVDRRGKPIAGVAIDVSSLPYPIDGLIHFMIPKSDRLLAPTITDNAGRFVMMLPEGVSPGLWASHPQYFGPGTSAKADSRVLDPLILEPAEGITGTVTDAAGKPVAGAIVAAGLIEYRVRFIPGTTGGEAVSDEHGRFLIGGLQPGVFDLLFDGVPGHDQLTARAVEGLRVRAGADTPADLTVIRGRPLQGVVIDGGTGQPVAGIQVGCHNPARPRSGSQVDSCKTDDQGRFTFHVPPGEQFVYIMDGVPGFNRLNRRDLVVPERGPIEPVRLLRISPANNASRDVMKVAVGKARAAKPKVQETGKAKTKTVMKNELPVLDAAKAKVVEKAEPPAPTVRTVTGHVRDPQGRPVFAVQVQVNPGMPAPGAEFQQFDMAATDREGVFILAGLPRRPLQITLTRASFKYQVEALPPDRDEVEFTYRLEPDPGSRAQPLPAGDEPIPPGLRERLTFVDLDPHGNDFLADGPGGGGDDLNRLPRGIHKLGDVYFRIGEKMIHVQGRERPDLPRSVKGIPVRAQADQLHFLHSTQGGANSEDTLIGAYIVHYDDGSTERIALVYSREITNWWHRDPGRKLTGAKVAWTGLNDSVAQSPRPGLFVRLFSITWTNPHPAKMITALDLLSAGKDCDPFLVALTLSRK
jgi:DNA-directed RNA polymerase specialized sigma24 family protein/protocatechuate 3,4-dioxygenase beta subunit